MFRIWDQKCLAQYSKRFLHKAKKNILGFIMSIFFLVNDLLYLFIKIYMDLIILMNFF